ncbi:acetyltransferase [Endomicrobiia bacterium]|uniref:N-acetyltransferase n=1 Tax=Endomicrobium trichonymphae TaxID=1408204 RepID=B1H005_ENDTX|nr:N-acetyltransferase [Candidatus Endomicrobium trichonymphae]BAG13837.1 N-acetyltransferase [Candidatus Endomicrobium trichonymphae]GHT08475.1 acetyltransferase [Endomicrobiia bacterium]GMO54065.1 MAG: N-acetyltransferase [Candidatus Endomicrobium trichonymphae]
MNIRPARVMDVKEIHKLVEYHANNKEMLHRSLSAIYENIQEFVVLESEDNIVGCGALHVSWENLAEIKALAVSDKYKGQGFGRKIVKILQDNAKNLGVSRVFALSFKPKFFIKLGYEIIPKETLPHKIWSECINCHLFSECGEVPLLITLK